MVNQWDNEYVRVFHADSLSVASEWSDPDVIVSDGAYGVSGFDGDASNYHGLAEWYAPHVEMWSKRAKTSTTLWFWNTEIGWATVHPVLESNGWRYLRASIWNKGRAHIAGNINTKIMRSFPAVSEMCVQYVRDVKIGNLPLQQWMLSEWKRTGLPLNEANKACGVKNAATRKYFDQGDQWYCPTEMFVKLREYANQHGDLAGKPYFSVGEDDFESAVDDFRRDFKELFDGMRHKFDLPYGKTNVWDRPSLRGSERCLTADGEVVHPNQKPVDLMKMIIGSSSNQDDVIWEPFGGMFTACAASYYLGRHAFGAEIDDVYFTEGVKRLIKQAEQPMLFR